MTPTIWRPQCDCGAWTPNDRARCLGCLRPFEDEPEGWNILDEEDISFYVLKDNHLQGDNMVNYLDIEKFEPKRVSLDGEKTTVDAVLNREVAFLDIIVSPSSFYEGDYAVIQIQDAADNLSWFRTSSKVLITQLSELKKNGELPKRAQIKKEKRYFTLC